MFIELCINSVRVSSERFSRNVVIVAQHRWIIIVCKKALRKNQLISWFTRYYLRSTHEYTLFDVRTYCFYAAVFCAVSLFTSQWSWVVWTVALFCITFTWNLINYTVVNVFVCVCFRWRVHGVWMLTNSGAQKFHAYDFSLPNNLRVLVHICESKTKMTY